MIERRTIVASKQASKHSLTLLFFNVELKIAQKTEGSYCPIYNG